MIVALALGAVFVLSWIFTWAWFIWLPLGIVTLLVVMVLVKPMVQGEELLDHEATFITCPNCGTKNPRHSGHVYECYNCEKRFSELSGRHPTLPSKVSGSNADD